MIVVPFAAVCAVLQAPALLRCGIAVLCASGSMRMRMRLWCLLQPPAVCASWFYGAPCRRPVVLHM